MNSNNSSFGNLSTASPSSTHCPLKEPDSDLVKEIKKAVYFLVASVGILSNIFVIIAAARFKVRKNLHHLIINMAVSDIIFIVVRTYKELYFLTGLFDDSTHPEPGILGDIVCKTEEFLFRVSFQVSLVTLLVISIERFRATRQTLQRSRPYTLVRKVAIIGVCWLIPAAVYSPFLVTAKMDVLWKYCEPFHEAKKLKLRPFTYLNDWVSAFLTCIIVSVVTVVSVLTIKRLYQNQGNNFNLMERTRLRRAQRIKAAVRMVVVSLILYTVCWIPYLILLFLKRLNLWYMQYAGKHLFELYPYCMIDVRNLEYMTKHLLPVLNSSLSPYIYIVFLSDFRGAALKLFCIRRRSQTISSERTTFTPDVLSVPADGRKGHTKEKSRNLSQFSATQSTVF